MRNILESVPFKHELKREAKGKGKGKHGNTLAAILRPVLVALTHDEPLDMRYRDLALTGHWRDCRDCHIKPDLILIYTNPGTDTLELLRLGSHSELRL